MEQGREGLFTIGEIGRIMGVNPKSLRYYDRIGVLRPAVVDEETGYRYYAPSQLGILSAIQVCIDLGIPLHRFSDYCREGEIHAAHFLKDAEEAARERIAAIERGMQFMGELKEQIDHADALAASGGKMICDDPEERCIVQEIPAGMTVTGYNRVLGELHMRIVERGLRTGLRFGKLALFRRGELLRMYAFISVAPDACGEKIMVLPPARYHVYQRESSCIERAALLYPAYFAQHDDVCVMETEMLSSTYRAETPDYALRLAAFMPKA